MFYDDSALTAGHIHCFTKRFLQSIKCRLFFSFNKDVFYIDILYDDFTLTTGDMYSWLSSSKSTLIGVDVVIDFATLMGLSRVK